MKFHQLRETMQINAAEINFPAGKYVSLIFARIALCNICSFKKDTNNDI